MSGTSSTGGHSQRKDFIRYPTNRVVGTLRDGGNARDAMAALLRAGFSQDDIDMLHGEADLRRLDPTGAEHGLLAQFQRSLIRTFDLGEHRHLTHHVEDVRAGRYVIMVLTKRREQRIIAGDILHQHGAEYVGFHGRWAWAELPPSHEATPAEVPALFAQAWNARDPDALASLFDKDAEFVTEAGVCWHDRESIRKAYTTRLQNINSAVLSTDETRVKLLSPEVAVVHSRMTLSGETPADPQKPALPRTTIVSFVVHRTRDRWLCASGHNTEFVPEANAVGS